MARPRLSMRAIREVLRLKYERGLSDREIAVSCGIKRSTTNDYINRARNVGLIWPRLADLSDVELESRLFPSNKAPAAFKPLPDFAHMDSELREYKRLNITKDLLWQEYREQHADGYSYSQFCHHYRNWLKKRDYCMRQEHRYGEKLFVDYGDGLYLTDARTGAKKLTQLFTAVWGASNYIYAEASLTQAVESWIGSHIRAFDYFDCAPLAIVPDCLKSAVDKMCRYEPDINSGYLNMAQHYGCAVVPARPVHPRDKAWVGYVFELEGVTYYHAGDTDFVDGMRDVTADVAFLPVANKNAMMGSEEAAKAAAAIAPKLAVPIHWSDKAQAQAFVAQFEGNAQILTQGKEY